MSNHGDHYRSREERPSPVVVMVDLTPVTSAIQQLGERLEHRLTSIEQRVSAGMATIQDANDRLTELVKDVKRVLDKVSNAPLPAATQQEVDDLVARLDQLDAEIESVDPEQPSQGDGTVTQF